MWKYLLAAVLMLVVTAAGFSAEAPEAKASIEGTWLLTGSTTPAGEKIPAELIDMLKGQFTFSKDGTYEQNAFDKKVEAGKYKIDAAKTPASIELEVVDGRNKGKSQLGIFTIEGDKLTVALGKAGSSERPKDFENSREAEISTYKRAE